MAYARLALLLVLLASPVVEAQQPRPEDSIDSIHLNESNQLGTRFRNAEARAAQGQWSEAIEEYQRILLDAGDELAPVDKQHVVQARWLAQARLSALPPQALTLYRSRIDPPAKKLLDQARALRDPILLHRIVDESFCSSFTDQALDLLGDLAFERGEFEEAEQLWKMIVRPASQPASMSVAGLAVTDPKINVAGIRAKQILAQLFRGESANLSFELGAFAKAHPAAKGKLAGRQGLYVEILRTLAKQTGELGTPVGTDGWPQFAGANERNRVLPKVEGRLAHLPCPEGPAWQKRLDGSKQISGDRPGSDKPLKISSWTERARLLGYYPAIAGDRVVVASAFHVAAYQLSTGEQIFKYDLTNNRDVSFSAKAQVTPDVSFPVAVVGDRVYARMGDKEAGPLSTQRGFPGRRRFGGFDPPPRDPPPQTYLVCLTMQPGLRQELWGQQPPTPGEQRAIVAYEGAPVVHQNRVYIAATQFLSGQIRSLILCYDADTGALHWQREVCSTSALNEVEKRGRHHLLTLAGPNIVYCSHSGAIVAVDAITGQVRWGVRYPSRGPKTADGQASFRSLAPCCYADGRIYAAPLDFDRVLCLDSRTGLTLWESEPMEIVHILGAARGKLFCSSLTPRCSLRALDAATGMASGGWMQPGDDSSLPTFGRGLLAGDLIFWPTQDGLHVLRQADGEPVAFDGNIRGNLAASDGCLISADDHYLSAYLPEKWTLRRRTQEAAQDGANALTFYRLGLAEMDAGLVDRARASLKRAWKEAEDQSLRDLARAKLHELLLDSAQVGRPKANGQAVEALLAEATAEPFLPAQRVRGLALRAKLLQENGKIEQAIGAWQTILDTPALGSATLAGPGDFPERAAAVAADAISKLIRQHGRSVYDAVEARAEKASKIAASPPEAARRLQREYPQALATVRSLEGTAARAEKLDRPGEAAAAYRLLLDIPDAPINRMLVLAGLARSYERETCYEAARSILDQMESEGGGRQEPALHPVLSVRDWVRERRRGVPQAKVQPSGQGASVNRRWQAPGDARGCSGLSESGDMLFRLAGDKLDCLSTASGKPIWTQVLASAGDWLGTSADLLIVASKREIVCLRQGDGAQVWKQDFASAEDMILGGWQVAGGRLHFFLGPNRFCAYDIARGRCLWCAWAPASRLDLAPPAGRFTPEALVSGSTCVLSTGLGKTLLLDSRTGNRIHREWRTDGEAWPVGIDGESRMGLVAGREMLQAVDVVSGKPAWQVRFENPLALSGEMPRVLHRDERVFVQIPYNYGYLLEYLNGKTGKREWPGAIFLGRRPLDLDLGDLDETTLYCAGPDGIEARALADGHLLWRKPTSLASARRKVERNGAALLCQAITNENAGWEFSWQGLSLRTPANSGSDSLDTYCGIEILDPASGQILQALNVPLPASARVHLTLQKSSYSLIPKIKPIGRAAPRLLTSPDRLIVMQGQAATAFDIIPDPGQPGLNGSP